MRRLGYNRFRYYNPELGQYIMQDPIGLEDGNPTLYGYEGDPNSLIDSFWLAAKCGDEQNRHNPSSVGKKQREVLRGTLL